MRKEIYLIAMIRCSYLLFAFFILSSRFLLAQSCTPPVVYTSQSIEDTSAMLRWFQLAPAPDYFEIRIWESELPSQKWQTTIEGSENSFFFNSLLSNTRYVSSIRSICGSDTSNSKFLSFRTAIRSGQSCQLNIPINDNSCVNGGQLIDYYIRDFPEDSLGKDTRLRSVDIIVDHSYPADLSLQLQSPSGEILKLVEHQGTIDDHFGDPSDSTCTLASHFSIYGCQELDQSTPPFIGTFKPEGEFDSINSKKCAVNGKWQLLICDRAGDDIGSLEYLNLSFENASCPIPPEIKPRSDGDTSLNVYWLGSGYDSLKLMWSSTKSSPDSINDPAFSSLKFGALTTEATIQNLALSTSYSLLSYIQCDGEWIGPSCINSIETTCAPIEFRSLWEEEDECIDCNHCQLSDPVWDNIGFAKWQVTDGHESGVEDFFFNGQYLYRDASFQNCISERAILQSLCLQSFETIDSSCFISLYAFFQSTSSGQLHIIASEDEFTSEDTIAILRPDITGQWTHNLISLPQILIGKTFKLRIISDGIENSFGDVGIGDISLHNVKLIPLIDQVIFPDADKDGFGASDSVVLFCGQEIPDSFSRINGDCSDSQPSINPSAIDIACNGIDENCDGIDNLNGADPLQIVLNSVIPPSCPGNRDGRIEIAAQGGVMPYQIQWSTGSNKNQIDSLNQGKYTVTITDRDQCQSAIQTIDLIDPDRLSVSVNIDQRPDCPDNNLGILKASVSGGSPPYHYLWSNRDTTVIADSLQSGVYGLIVKDQASCEFVLDSIQLNARNLSANLLSIRELSCINSSNAALRVVEPFGVKCAEVFMQKRSPLRAGA